MITRKAFEVLRDYRIGSLLHLEDSAKGISFVYKEDGRLCYIHKDKEVDCLLLLGLLETMSFIIRPSYDLREILDQ